MEPLVQSISLALAFIGVLMVLLTRFMKVGLALTTLSFACYFYLLGLDNAWSLIFIFLGLFLFAFEMFIPDFGILGLAGIASFVFGIYLTTSDWWAVIQDVSIATIFTGLIAIILFKNGLMTKRWDHFVLNSSLPKKEQAVSAYEKQAAENQLQLGQQGRTLTLCRPSGFAQFQLADGQIKKVDVQAESTLIEKDVPIEIIAINENNIIVRSVH